MKRLAFVVAFGSMSLAAGGCMRGAKEGVALFTGGQGSYQVLQPPAEPLTAFDSIEIGAFTSAFGPAPASLPELVRAKLANDLAEKGQPVNVPDRKVLLVRGTIIYYESARGLADQVFGPLEEAVADVELVDKASGRVIAKAACVGRSSASVSQGVETKAEGLAEAITKWIDRFRPVRLSG